MSSKDLEARATEMVQGRETESQTGVLLIDDCPSFIDNIGRSFRDLGDSHNLWVAKTFPDALELLEITNPDLIISELRVGGRLLFEFLPSLVEARPLSSVAVATVYPSVATAVRLIRMGLGAYFTKPVSAKAILGEIQRERHDQPSDRDGGYCWPSLNRTVWEYLNQVYVAAGSMSEAARRLGVDRRSLRRMLAKYPPAR